jgi:hypothetical protein
MRQFFILAILAADVGFRALAFGGAGSETSSMGQGTRAGRVPTFTVDQAIQTALRQNPTLLEVIQEIERTKGVIIEIRAQASHNYS